MAGVHNKAARQIDLRGRVPGRIGAAAICRITLNPGFNIVDDREMAICLKNKPTQDLIDGGVVVVGVLRTREDELVAMEVANHEKQIHTLAKPTAAASLLPDRDRQRLGGYHDAGGDENLLDL